MFIFDLFMFHATEDTNKEDEQEEEEDGEEIGGLFRVVKQKMEADREGKYNADLLDSSKFLVSESHDWQLEEVCGAVLSVLWVCVSCDPLFFVCV